LHSTTDDRFTCRARSTTERKAQALLDSHLHEDVRNQHLEQRRGLATRVESVESCSPDVASNDELGILEPAKLRENPSRPQGEKCNACFCKAELGARQGGDTLTTAGWTSRGNFLARL